MTFPTSPSRCFVIILGLLVFGSAAPAEHASEPKPLRVALYADAGASRDGSPHLWRCLSDEHKFNVKKVTAEEIRNGVLHDFDVVIHPGGSGSKQGLALGEDGRERVRQFVADGGGFVGICAGAYLASAYYPWSLHLLDARVVDREHWARGHGNVELRLAPAGRAAFAEPHDVITAYYHQGPLLAPAENDEISDYEVLAEFKTEIADNGAPKGVMLGTTAIACAPFGAGRVICFSPHLEKTPGRDQYIRAAVAWAGGRPDAEDETDRE